MDALAERAQNPQVLGKFNSQEVANTVWGFSKLGVMNMKMIDVLAKRAMQPEVMATFNAQEVANTVWAFAKIDVLNRRLMQVNPNLGVRT